MVSPSKCVKYLEMHFLQLEAIYPDDLSDTCLKNNEESLLGRDSCCHLHSAMHYAYGRLYNEHSLGPGYCYVLKVNRTPNIFTTFPLLENISGFILSIHNRILY